MEIIVGDKMKRIYLIALSCFLILALCACSNNEKPSDIVEKPPVSEVEVDMGNDIKLTLKGDFLDEYSDPVFDGLDVNKFLGTAIVKVRPEEYQAFDIPIISEDSPDAKKVLSLMHLSTEYLDSYAISTTTNVTRAYTVAIIKPTAYSEEFILDAFDSRIYDLYSQVKDYPDQLYLVENFVLKQVGDFIVFIICDNADEVFDAIFKVMGNTDLTTIVPVPYMTEEERVAIEEEVLKAENLSLEEEIGEVIVTPVDDLDAEYSEDMIGDNYNGVSVSNTN